MKIFITICWLFIFTKLLFFWVYLWQLKEYHWPRFRAHFETQKVKKLIFSFYGFRSPRVTKKTVLILFFGFLTEFLILIYFFSLDKYLFYPVLLVLIIFAPIIFSLLVLFFQIPTAIFKKKILEKARKKARKFSEAGGVVIGITGSYGKSSTKEFLATILSKKFKVLKTERNINSEIGIAQTVLTKLKPEHQIFIAEIGAYEKGKIKEVCRMLGPKIGVLTGINEQHLSTFGSQKNIIEAKFELINSLPENGIAILNGNNKYCLEFCRRIKKNNNSQKIICPAFSTAVEKASSDIWTEDIRIEKEFIYFKIKTKGGDLADFKINLLGRQNVGNILLAAACAKELGMSLEEISRACFYIKPEQGGIKLLRDKNPVILDSSYSANPTGVMADLDYLKIYSAKRVVVMPCLIELGKKAKKVHQRIGRKIAEICDLAIITTNDYFKEIRKGAIKKGMDKEKILFINNPEEIAEKVKSYGSESVVLLEGRTPQSQILVGLLSDKLPQGRVL
jgi:UDP-N-acetylmuramoyl-tripeptide--D-alanyl-D-alanine ligase